MRNPKFGGTINLGQVDIAVANTDSSGGGTINVLLTGASKLSSATFDASTDKVTVPNWSKLSDDTIDFIKEGDIVSIVSTAGAPGGVSASTDYIISDLAIDGSDNATFKLLNASTFAVIDITSAGTAPHIMRFPCGTRVDSVDFINSQIAVAASSANVGKLFMKARNSSTWFLVREIALPAVTRSASVIGNRQTMTFTGGLFVPEGAQLGATIYVYAGVQDRTTVYASQSSNF